MTAKPDILPTLDPVAFVLALVLAPLVVALLFCWALLIPVLAVIFGGVPYLVFGTPVLLWLATRVPLHAGRLALVGMGVQGLFLVCLAVWGRLAHPEAEGLVVFYGLFGLPMAALWFAAFAVLYRRFWRPVLPLLPEMC
jgi:hypothetical protein